MRVNKVITIMLKEIEEAVKSKYVLFSVIGMPVLLGLVMPLAQLAPFTDPSILESDDPEELAIPWFKLTDNWDQLEPQVQFIIFMIEMSNIIFLLIPMILPTVVASDTFSGEKDRKTAEALVAAPVTDTEIYLGKTLSSLAPSVLMLWIVGIIYIILVNILTKPIIGYNYLPNVTFLGLLIFIAPLSSLAVVNFMIWVSTRTTSTRDAQQLGSIITLPLMGLMVGVIGLQIILTDWVGIILVILVLSLIDFFLIKMGISILDREKWVSN
ncbi:MAG: ABC transporter permease subunit [Candidatus Heimdallarchaeota archaeon]|nr:ABC transporter permease subunit [Candidatus Heimdallarchaeota archaeon]